MILARKRRYAGIAYTCNKLHCCTFTTIHIGISSIRNILHQLLSPLLTFFVGRECNYTAENAGTSLSEDLPAVNRIMTHPGRIVGNRANGMAGR